MRLSHSQQALVSGGAEPALAASLRSGEPAVVCRVQDGKLLFDLRAVDGSELEELAGAVLAALA